MGEISFLTGEALLAGIWLLLRLAVWIRRGKIDGRREAQLLLMYVNLAVILRFTFYPMETVGGRVQPLLYDGAAVFPLRVNLVPLVHLLSHNSRREVLLNVIGNFALFIPSGVLFPVLYKRLGSFWRVVGAGALLSLSIELAQLPFAVRATDIDDLILNTLGVAAGYGLFRLLRRPSSRRRP